MDGAYCDLCQVSLHIRSAKKVAFRFHEIFSLGAVGLFPKIGGKPPKWMVKIMENPIKIHDFGGTIIFGNTHICVERDDS